MLRRLYAFYFVVIALSLPSPAKAISRLEAERQLLAYTIAKKFFPPEGVRGEIRAARRAVREFMSVPEFYLKHKHILREIPEIRVQFMDPRYGIDDPVSIAELNAWISNGILGDLTEDEKLEWLWKIDRDAAIAQYISTHHWWPSQGDAGLSSTMANYINVKAGGQSDVFWRLGEDSKAILISNGFVPGKKNYRGYALAKCRTAIGEVGVKIQNAQ